MWKRIDKLANEPSSRGKLAGLTGERGGPQKSAPWRTYLYISFGSCFADEQIGDSDRLSISYVCGSKWLHFPAPAPREHIATYFGVNPANWYRWNLSEWCNWERAVEKRRNWISSEIRTRLFWFRVLQPNMFPLFWCHAAMWALVQFTACWIVNLTFSTFISKLINMLFTYLTIIYPVTFQFHYKG